VTALARCVAPRRAMRFCALDANLARLDDIREDAMSRMFVVAALAAACLIGSNACGSARAESSVKSSKSTTSEKTKPGGQSQSGGTSDRGGGSNGGGRTDSDYGQSGPKGR